MPTCETNGPPGPTRLPRGKEFVLADGHPDRNKGVPQRNCSQELLLLAACLAGLLGTALADDIGEYAVGIDRKGRGGTHAGGSQKWREAMSLG